MVQQLGVDELFGKNLVSVKIECTLRLIYCHKQKEVGSQNVFRSFMVVIQPLLSMAVVNRVIEKLG